MKNRTFQRMLAALAAIFLSVTALDAREGGEGQWYWGTFHSPKGFGASLEIDEETSHFISLSAYADLHYVYFGDASTPGFRASYLYNIVLHEHMAPEGMRCQLFIGPGVTAGYGRDRDMRKGFIGGLACAAGARFTFPSRFSVTVGLQADFAAHVDIDQGGTKIGLFEDGLQRSYYPQLTIHYHF